MHSTPGYTSLRGSQSFCHSQAAREEGTHDEKASDGRETTARAPKSSQSHSSATRRWIGQGSSHPNRIAQWFAFGHDAYGAAGATRGNQGFQGDGWSPLYSLSSRSAR